MEFNRNLPVLQRLLLDYCQLLLCKSDESSLRCDSVFNCESDLRSGASALALAIVTIKDTVTTQAKELSFSYSSSYNNPLVPAVSRGDFTVHHFLCEIYVRSTRVL